MGVAWMASQVAVWKLLDLKSGVDQLLGLD